MLLLNQKNSEKEGIFEFIVTNIPEFDDYADVLPLVQNAVQKARWRCDYTRRLTATNVRLDYPVRYIGDSMHRNVRTYWRIFRTNALTWEQLGVLQAFTILASPQTPHCVT